MRGDEAKWHFAARDTESLVRHPDSEVDCDGELVFLSYALHDLGAAEQVTAATAQPTQNEPPRGRATAN